MARRRAPRDDYPITTEEACTRVLLVDLDTMPHELIRHDLADVPDVAVVGAPAGAPIEGVVGDVGADVVLIGRDDPDVAAQVLRTNPLVMLLALIRDARGLVLYELRPTREELGVFSKDKLIATLRRARRPRSTWLP